MAVPRIYQHRVLFWGILGALVMRGALIVVGAGLIARYHWILYVFGAFLLVTAVKMLIIREHGDPAQNVVVRWTKRLLPVTDQFHGQHFLVRAGSARSRKSACRGSPRCPTGQSSAPGRAR
jgi:tellurite resistance protein TerC